MGSVGDFVIGAFYPRYGIIQVEEWHSSDRLHGTVRAPRSAQIRALKWR